MLSRRVAQVVHGATMATSLLGDLDETLAATHRVLAEPVDTVVLTTGIGTRPWFAAAESAGLDDALRRHVTSARVVARGPKALHAARAEGLEVAGAIVRSPARASWSSAPSPVGRWRRPPPRSTANWSSSAPRPSGANRPHVLNGPTGRGRAPYDAAMTSATFDRAAALDRLAAEEFDVLVVGGGATGAGVALDVASRGLRTALVERHDFAAGTSSLSSKMIHGGIRYLQQFEIGLVYQSLHERQRMLANVPHLVRTLPFVMVIYTNGGIIPRFLARFLSIVLWFYDVTGGAKIGAKHKRLDRDGRSAGCRRSTRSESTAATCTTTPRSMTPGSC